jgi:hypothetical protein
LPTVHVLQAITLADFATARSIPLDDLCPGAMKVPMLEGLAPVHRQLKGPLDLSPAKDSRLSDVEAVKAILADQPGIHAEDDGASSSLLHFAVLLRVRARRRCQARAYRQFVLRMRMKGMYALMTNSKAASASAHPAARMHGLRRAPSIPERPLRARAAHPCMQGSH